MKRFISLALKSGFGAFGAVALYVLVTGLIVFKSVDPGRLVVQSLFGGGVLGIIFALVHIRLAPSFKSSLITAASYIGATVLISLYAGMFGPFDIRAITALIAATLSLGTGTYFGSKIGRK